MGSTFSPQANGLTTSSADLKNRSRYDPDDLLDGGDDAFFGPSSDTPAYGDDAAAANPFPFVFSGDADTYAVATAAAKTAAVTPLPAGFDDVDAAVNGDAARADFGVNGTGIKIGIISDSFNTQGLAAAAEADGALPAASMVHDLLDSSVKSTDEGLAMAEIAHSIAPDAQIYFATCGNSPSSMASAISLLQSQGCQVIVDDVSFAGEPMFGQDDVISDAINAAVAKGVSYFTAAGNAGDQSAYEANFTAATGWTFTLGNETYKTLANFGTAANPNPLEQVNIPGGIPVDITLEWNQPYATQDGVGAGSGAQYSLGLALFQQTKNGLVFVGALNGNEVGNDPVQFGEFTPTTSGTYDIVVYENGTASNFTGSPGAFEVEIQNDSDDPVTLAGADTGTVYGHEADPDAITVGAVPVSDPAVTEIYSSDGKINLLAPDGNPTTVPGLDPFFGTSAAAPAAAAVGALVMQGFDADTSFGKAGDVLDEADVEHILADAATPVDYTPAGSSGSSITETDPSLTGAGLVDAALAVQEAETLTFDETQLTPTLYGTDYGATFVGGAGSHTLVGEGGVNTLDYSAAKTAVSVNFSTGTASNGYGGTDSFSDIQIVKAPDFANSFVAGAQGGTIDSGAVASTLDVSKLASGGTLTLGGGTFVSGNASDAGTIDVTAGSLTFSGALANSGLLEASGGSIDVSGALTGTGTDTVAGGLLTLGSSVAAQEIVSFGAGNDILALGDAQAFAGTVSAAAGSSWGIDLANFAFSGAKIASVSGSGKAGTDTVVTIADGSLSATVDLLNQYAQQFAPTASGYQLANAASVHSGESGTLLTLAPANV